MSETDNVITINNIGEEEKKEFEEALNGISNEQTREDIRKKAETDYAAALFNVGSNYFFHDKEKSEKFLKKAADLGNSDALYNLGMIYQMYKTNSFDKALEYYQQAAEKGSIRSLVTIASFYLNGNGVEKNIDKAIEYFQQAADRGEVTALNTLANIYLNGNGVEKNIDEAIKYFKLAADKGDVKAIDKIVDIYLNGNGVEKNIDKAIEYFKQAADKGNTNALNKLSDIYLNGDGVEKNIDKAIKYFKLAADKGNTAVLNKLGDIYLNGNDGVEKDIDEAIKYFKQAADKGNTDVLNKLTEIYSGNKELSQDNKDKILSTLQQLANNNINALRSLGKLYLEEDKNKAIEYFQKAADKGDNQALFMLSNLYPNLSDEQKENLLNKTLDGISKGSDSAIERAGNIFNKHIQILKEDERIKILNTFSKVAKNKINNAVIGDLYFIYSKNNQNLTDNEKKIVLETLEDASKDNVFTLDYLWEIYLNIEKDEKRALKYCEKAAELGDIHATNNLGYCYLNGKGVEKDGKRAFEYFQKSANLGNKEGYINLGICYEEGIGVEKDDKKAFECYKKYPDDDARINFCLFKYYNEGKGTEKDDKKIEECYNKIINSANAEILNKLGDYFKEKNIYEKAIECYQKSAEKDNINAIMNLGEIYYSDDKPNLEEALKYYEKGASLGDGYCSGMTANIYLKKGEEEKAKKYYQIASDLGDPDSLKFFGDVYATGSYGYEKNLKKAFEYFEKATNNEYNLIFEIAENYRNGQNGIDKDPQKAIYFYEKSAEKGNSNAMYNLGKMYANEEGVEKDLKEAAVYFQKAVDNDKHMFSAFNLALCYENEKGVEKNFEKAREMYEIAASQGDVYSMINLAYYYENGIGVEKNEEKAKQLYKEVIEKDHISIKKFILFYKEDYIFSNKDLKKVERFSQIAREIEEKKKQEKDNLKTQAEQHNNNINRLDNANEKKQSVENPNKYKIDKFAKDIGTRRGSISIKELEDTMKDIPEKKDLLENEEFLKMRISAIEIDGKSYSGFGGNMNYSPETNGDKITITFEEGGFFMDQLERMGMEKECEMFKNGAIVIDNVSKLGENGVADFMAKFKVSPIEAYKEICSKKDIEIKYADEKNPEGQKIDGEFGKVIENSLEKVTDTRNVMSDIKKYSENIEQNKDNNVDQDCKKTAEFVRDYSMNILKSGKVDNNIGINTTGLKDSVAIGKQTIEYLKTMDFTINRPENIEEEQKDFLNDFKEKNKEISKLIDRSGEAVFINCIASTLNESLKTTNEKIDIIIRQKEEEQNKKNTRGLAS